MSDSHIDRHKLQAKRIRARLTQPGLAKRAGLSKGTISAIELGTRSPMPETLGKLADGLRCDIAELMPDGLDPELVRAIRETAAAATAA